MLQRLVGLNQWSKSSKIVSKLGDVKVGDRFRPCPKSQIQIQIDCEIDRRNRGLNDPNGIYPNTEEMGGLACRTGQRSVKRRSNSPGGLSVPTSTVEGSDELTCQDRFFTDLISTRGLGVRGWSSGKTEMLRSIVTLPE